MDEDLGVSFDSLIELIVGHLRIIDTNLVTDDETRFSFSRDDQIPEVSIVLLDIALAGG
jgi:hypothetical protein